MAKKLKKMPMPHRRSWNLGQYLDGNAWELTEGVDFSNSNVLRSCILQMSKRRGLRVTVRKTKDGVYAVQAWKVNG